MMNARTIASVERETDFLINAVSERQALSKTYNNGAKTPFINVSKKRYKAKKAFYLFLH